MPLILAVYVFIVFGFRSKQYVFVEPRNEAHETAEGMVAHTGSPPFTPPLDLTVWGFFCARIRGTKKGTARHTLFATSAGSACHGLHHIDPHSLLALS